MAHLLNAEAVTVIHGSRTLLDAVSLGLDDGDRDLLVQLHPDIG